MWGVLGRVGKIPEDIVGRTTAADARGDAMSRGRVRREGEAEDAVDNHLTVRRNMTESVPKRHGHTELGEGDISESDRGMRECLSIEWAIRHLQVNLTDHVRLLMLAGRRASARMRSPL